MELEDDGYYVLDSGRSFTFKDIDVAPCVGWAWEEEAELADFMVRFWHRRRREALAALPIERRFVVDGAITSRFSTPAEPAPEE